MLCPDVMYYGSRMVQVSPLDHDGSGENWVVFQAENIRQDTVVVQPKETKEQRAGRH